MSIDNHYLFKYLKLCIYWAGNDESEINNEFLLKRKYIIEVLFIAIHTFILAIEGVDSRNIIKNAT